MSIRTVWYLPVILFLTACGGSGGDSDDSVGEVSDTPVVISEISETSETEEESDSIVVNDEVSDPPIEILEDSDPPVTADEETDIPEPDDNIPVSLDDPNVAPVVNSFTSTISTLMITETLAFEWSVSDVNASDILSCTIDADGDGTVDYTVVDCQASVSQTHIYDRPGDYEAVFVVSDGQGGSDTQTTLVTVLPVLLQIAAADPVQAGGRVAYQLSVSNVGLVPVNDVTVQIRVPAGLDFAQFDDVDPDTVCGTCSEGDEAEWDYASLDVGESQSISINSPVLPGVIPGSEIDLNVTVTAQDLAENIVRSKTVRVDNRPESVVAISADSDSLVAGETVSFDIDVGNISATNLQDTMLLLQVPEGVSASAVSDGGFLSDTSNTVIWNLGTVPVQDARRVSLDLTVPVDAVPGRIVFTRAELRHDGASEPNASDEYTVSVTETESPLQVVLSAVNDPVAAGGRSAYEFTVSNIGLVPLNNVRLLYRIPKWLDFRQFDDVNPDTVCGTCMEGDEAEWEYDSLSAGESQTIVINAPVLAEAPAGSLIRATVHVTADGVLDSISRVVTVRVNNRPVSQLAISAATDALIAGETVDVDLVVGNTSAGDLANASLLLQLPDGVSAGSISDGGSLNNNEISWNLGSIAVLEGRRVNAQLTVGGNAVPGQILGMRSELTHDDGVSLDDTAEHAITVSEVSSPISVQITPDSETVSAGGRLRYTFTLTNNGLIPYNNVNLLFRIPFGLDFRQFDDTEPDTVCGQCSEGDEAEWNFDTLAAGQSTSIVVNSPVIPEIRSGSLIESRVTVTADGVLDGISLIDVVTVQ